MFIQLYFLICAIASVTFATCSNNCGICVGDKCERCAQGFYASGNSCTRCPQGCLSCLNKDYCNACEDSFGFSNGTCSQCMKGCKQCEFVDGRYNCVSCKSGYYKDDNSCKSCSKNCISCLSSNKCEHCNNKSFLNGSQCSACPEACMSCESSVRCLQCKSGYYGSACNNTCSDGCKANICNAQTGHCTCKSGKYGYFCTQKCPDTCETCYSDSNCSSCKPGYYGNTCEQCLQGKYGTNCENNCPFNCAACHSEKNCTLCRLGYFGDSCLKCSDHCADGPCDNVTGTCTKCKDNYSGPFCNECTTSFFDSGIGWRPGHYGDNCDSFCPDNCQNKSCSQTGLCHICISGYYGKQCTDNCPLNCHKRECTNYGLCHSCIDGYFGAKCDNKCPEHCETCVSSIDCRSCRTGYHGNSCQSKCVGCKSGSSCDLETGHCQLCEDGFFGNECNGTCSKQCKTCNSFSDNCTSCTKGLFGKHNDNQTLSCDSGCIVGFYGKTCDMKCSDECLNSTCSQDDGACILGCRFGRDGLACEHEKKGSSITITGLAVTIALIIITLSVCIFIAVNKRTIPICKKRRNVMSDEIATYCEMDMFQHEEAEIILSETPVYMNIGNSERDVKVTTHVYINLENTMVKRRSETDDLSKSRETIISIVELDVGDVNYSEENQDKLEADIVGSEIYGNTRELQQRRISVNDLKDYVNKKSTDNMTDEFVSLPRGLIKSYDVSQKKKNASKNRYKGIYPYDKNRVKIVSSNGNKYINASYIDGYNKRRAYIACMGPTAKHMDNFIPFWEMVWQENVHIIVMLTNIIELGIAKCDKYWPDIGHTEKYDDVLVTCQLEEKSADFVVREFIMEKAQITRICHHIHFTSWPDKSIPSTTSSIVDLQRKVRQYKSASDGPLVVHCSAGIGRTGTFIALDILTNEGEADGHVDIYACVRNLREERVNFVQTLEQYCYLHEAIVESLTRDLGVQEKNSHVHEAVVEPVPSDQNVHVKPAVVDPVPSDPNI